MPCTLSLPLHLVGLVALAEAERGGEVASEHVDLLDVGEQRLVDSLLVGRPAARDLLLLCILSVLPLTAPAVSQDRKFRSYLGLLSLLEKGLLAGLLLGLLRGEVLRLRDLLDLGLVDTGKVDFQGCGDDVSRVDAAEGDAVDLEGAGDEQDTLVEVLEEDDTLAAEAAGEQNQDGAGLERAARSPGADGLADLINERKLASILYSRRAAWPPHPCPESCRPLARPNPPIRPPASCSRFGSGSPRSALHAPASPESN
jgi:hypothetical protein